MRVTEAALWKYIKRDGMARVETGMTAAGVSDVEYVLGTWHGWVELKAVLPPRVRKPYTLHTPFTVPQLQWLVRHHIPRQRLRSWLLLGVAGAQTWRELVLLPPPQAVHLLNVRTPVAHEFINGRPGVVRCTGAEDLYHALTKE